MCNWKGQEKAPKLFSTRSLCIHQHCSVHIGTATSHLSAPCEHRIVIGTGERGPIYFRKTERKRKANALLCLCLPPYHNFFPPNF